MEMASATASTSSPERGMIDCGATASAAPEAVVQGLISAILEKDKEARIDIDQSARPYFRFGDGRWGRALYRVRLSSDVSGNRRHFALYALPNPPEYYKANFDKSTLVPILVGMGFLGKDGNGMIIDFTNGMTVSSHDEHPEVVHLNQNHKGHFLLDVVQFLTCGHERSEGHAHVVIMSADASLSPSPEVHVLELHPMQIDLAVSDVEYEERILECSRQKLLGLHALSRASTNRQLLPAPCVGQHLPVLSRQLPLRRLRLMEANAPQHYHLDPDAEQAVVQNIRGQTAPKAKAKPLDISRVMKADPRDPRSSRKTWPCYGTHLPGRSPANQHGQWVHCATCDLRLAYTPRKGSTSQHTVCHNPAMIERTLRELRPLMREAQPTAAIVRAMLAKINAEEALHNSSTITSRTSTRDLR